MYEEKENEVEGRRKICAMNDDVISIGKQKVILSVIYM